MEDLSGIPGKQNNTIEKRFHHLPAKTNLFPYGIMTEHKFHS